MAFRTRFRRTIEMILLQLSYNLSERTSHVPILVAYLFDLITLAGQFYESRLLNEFK